MKKKRLGLASSKKAQITIFMIVGLVILFIAIFTLALVSKIQKSQLNSQLEDLVSRSFEKEGLRIYVEDCLQDGLEEALLLLGQQGGLWRDQAGGITSFSPYLTGVNLNGESASSGGRVFYGITNLSYQNFAAYPCLNQLDDNPFCKYSYPETGSFGRFPLITKDHIAGDLRRYLIKQTVFCVENFTKTNISSQAEIKPAELQATLDLNEEGISVSIEYPITFTLGGDEYFSLKKFDLLYPTEFYTYLNKYILSPLRWDQQYVDFPYTKETLDQGNFNYNQTSSCLNSNFDSTTGWFNCQRDISSYFGNLPYQLEITTLDYGDDLYTFRFPGNAIIHGQQNDYVYRIARQNRQPALDYIERCSIGDNADYDYLVVKGAENDLGKITFTPQARDPDEDEITYSFIMDDQEEDIPTTGSFNVLTGFVTGNSLEQPLSGIATEEIISTNQKTFTVTASDGELNDAQTVRLRIDPLFKPEVNFRNLVDGSAIISLEDPFCIEINYPGLPQAASSPGFTFKLGNKELHLTSGESGFVDEQGLFYPSCDLQNFNNVDIQTYGERITDYFSATGENTLQITGEVKYGEDPQCSYQVDDSTKKIEISQCTSYTNPVDDPENPLPFIPGKPLILGRNPFSYSHTCCTAEGMLVEAGTVCYPDDIGCFGQVVGNEDQTKLEKKIYTCDGLRGNVCGSAPQTALAKNEQGQILCGDSKYSSCLSAIEQDLIDQECQGKPANSVIIDPHTGGTALCYGTTGCYFCPSNQVHNGQCGKS